jgi:hypothetical protein
MKIQIVKNLFLLLILSISFIICSGVDWNKIKNKNNTLPEREEIVSKDKNQIEGALSVELVGDLPSCSQNFVGELLYIEEIDLFQVCNGADYITVNFNGKEGLGGIKGVTIIWYGPSTASPMNPEKNWYFYNIVEHNIYFYDGMEWQVFLEVNGEPVTYGNFIEWQGSLTSAPSSPNVNWAYYNTTDGVSYIWDGDSWEILSQDGMDGPVGTDGLDGVSIVWQGSLLSAPASPLLNWGYYNIMDGISYIWDGDSWEILAQDGNSSKVNWFEENVITPFTPLAGSGVVFDSKMWIISGIIGDYAYTESVWYSTDGTNWIESTSTPGFSGRAGHVCLNYNGKMWVIAGASGIIDFKNDVWSSDDGITWNEETAAANFSARHKLAGVVYDNKMWIIGGYVHPLNYMNDVWNSTDGITWNEVTSSADFPGRELHSAVVYDGRIWIIGGYDYNIDERKNDVWYSYDGVTWIEATGSANFSKRDTHSTIVHNSKMYVIGGYADEGMKNDIWYSSDGISWSMATDSADFSGRGGHISLFYQDRIRIMGGWDGSQYINDSWFSY